MRLTFLSHFVICLAVIAAAFFAWRAGAPQMVYANDASMMTSVIAGLVVVAAAYLGWQAWDIDSIAAISGFARRQIVAGKRFPDDSAAFGHLAEKLAPCLGMLGTVIGLSLQAKNLVTGAASFGALSTGLYSTGCGIVGMMLIMLMTFNLEAGIRRVRQ